MRPESLQPPKPHKAKICMWKYLDVHSMDLINNAGTTDELKRLLSDLFNLKDFESNPRSAILLDLYFYTIQFSREQSFNREQTSVFFSIVRDVHEACVETPLPNVEECYKYFSELMFCHSIRRPPFSIDLFNQDQLVLLSDYMINTYFRHYKLYKYAFTPQVRLDISFTYVGMPEPESKGEGFQIGDGLFLNSISEIRSLGKESWTLGVQEAMVESTEAGLSPLQEELEEAGGPAESPTAALRDFIVSQLNQELTQLRLSIDQRLKVTEDQFNAKLIQLEKGSAASKGVAKGKKK